MPPKTPSVTLLPPRTQSSLVRGEMPAFLKPPMQLKKEFAEMPRRTAKVPTAMENLKEKISPIIGMPIVSSSPAKLAKHLSGEIPYNSRFKRYGGNK
jgi:hypothetical protein